MWLSSGRWAGMHRVNRVLLLVAVLCMLILAADDGWHHVLDIVGGMGLGAGLVVLWQLDQQQRKADSGGA
jgi:membrane-associated phospholipid phosphatase